LNFAFLHDFNAIKMKNLPVIYSVVLLTLLGCSTSKKSASASNSLVDTETPKAAQPLIIDTAFSSTNSKGWVLDFSDEFNDNKIDTGKWTIENSIKKRVDITLFSDDNQVEEKDGHAFIYYRKAPEKHDSAYYVGRFNSKGKYAPTHGFLEAKMHLVKPNGYQTAFWTMPNSGTSMSNAGPHDGTANDGAEIDIVEGNKLKTYSLGLHWDGYEKGTHKGAGGNIKISNLHDVEYHVFGLEWTPTYLKFYCDGKVVKEITDPKAIPQVAEFIIFSGSCWGVSDWVNGDVRQNEFIQKGGVEKGYVDYLRVYKKK
jgi:beta-glucanase (GH16 family)